MNFVFNDRMVRVHFTKTVSANPLSPLQNEINDSDLRNISSNKNWWNDFIPRHLENRCLKLSKEWFNHIQLQSEDRFPERNDLLVTDGSITDLFTRADMADFPNDFGQIRIYAIETIITAEGPVDIVLHLHKDA